MSKYNYLNKDPYSVHQKIINFVGQNKHVLDVGCSEGLISKKINENNCKVVGIELDSAAAQIAENYCQDLIVGNVESINLDPKYEKYFDIIIFADILEHLKEPSNVLNRFKKYLKDEGFIIISLPNISNWRIRLQILFGNFEYQEYGILDIGHIRFFNEKTAKQMINEAGYEIKMFDLTVGDVKRFSNIFHSIGMKWPNLLAFQFFFVAKKNRGPRKIKNF
jgi:O-antigen biosynthesis protein